MRWGLSIDDKGCTVIIIGETKRTIGTTTHEYKKRDGYISYPVII